MNKEVLDNTSENTNNEAEKSPLEKMPSFKEHMKQNHQERLQRFMEISGVKRTRENEEQFRESLRQLDGDGIYNYLNHINGILRGVDKKERGRRDDVQIGDHLAPPPQVQRVALSETADALKSINDNKYRAALAYYVVNGLHLFPDGNGRTSRAVYEMLENSDFDLASAESLAYHSQRQSYGHGKFEKEKGIEPSVNALTYALNFLKVDLAKAGRINPRALKKRTRIEIFSGLEPDIYLTEDAADNLSDQEKRMVNRAFMEGDIAIIALSGMLTMKGAFDDVADANTRNLGDEEYVAIEVMKEDMDTGEPNELAQKTFQGWTADDYRMFIKAVRGVQKMQYEKLIDFFKTPDSYSFSNGIKVADYLSGKQK